MIDDASSSSGGGEEDVRVARRRMSTYDGACRIDSIYMHAWVDGKV
jgi:hypothetical protein